MSATRGTGIDWRGEAGGRLAAQVLDRLKAGRPLTDLPVPRDGEGRADLRGFVFPPPRAVGRLGGRWGRGKLIEGTTELKKVTLRGLDLSGASGPSLRLHGCELVDCVLDRADLPDLRLWDTTVTDCSFAGAKLKDAAVGTWDRGRRNTWRRVSFTGADLRGAVAVGAVFEECDFGRARLDGLHFEQCALDDCTFAGRMREVVFDGRALPDRPAPQPLRRADFSGAEFRDVEFWDCRVADVTLPGTPGLGFVPEYRATARRALEVLADDPSREARMLVGELTEALRGPGDDSAVGLFNRQDYVDAGGEALAELAQRLLVPGVRLT
ncbi:pentapeptide repeat-containing protein [Streptomyces sp. NPDC049541]|uniref:pentapeptide repeat-containing protein n=1 Tax=Streptomyces sp. NPDC049541 TaxID=3365594 RepID=UPI0037B5FFAD